MLSFFFSKAFFSDCLLWMEKNLQFPGFFTPFNKSVKNGVQGAKTTVYESW